MSPGPTPKYGKTLSSAQKMQAMRKRQSLLSEAMDRHNLLRVSVFIDKKQLAAIHFMDQKYAGIGGDGRGVRLEDTTSLSIWLWRAFKRQLERELENIDPNSSNPCDLKLLKLKSQLPQFSLHELAQLEAKNAYLDWARKEFGVRNAEEN